MITARHLTLGLYILLLALALLVAALIATQHLSAPRVLAATAIEYATHAPSISSVEY
jgi:hypothetical protein